MESNKIIWLFWWITFLGMMAKMKEEMRTDMVKDLERREAELREEMAGQLEKMETHIGRMCRLESFKCGMKYAHRWRHVMLSFQDTIDASRNLASLHRDQKTGECEGSYVIIILKWNFNCNMDIYLVQQIPWEFMIAVSILSGEKMGRFSCYGLRKSRWRYALVHVDITLAHCVCLKICCMV